MTTLEKETERKNERACGFTLTELLIVLAAIAFLAVLALPTVRHAKAQAQVTKCLDNMNQLMIAAQMYADDNKGLWFPNEPGQTDWVTDSENWTPGIQANTNSQVLLAAPGSALANATFCSSFFASYIRNPLVYKCPSDPSAVGGVPRIRSYSASQAVGTCWAITGSGPCAGPANGGVANGPVTGQWLAGAGGNNNCQNFGFVYQKTTQMIHPNPANLWVFAEEHPDSINDSTFAVQIADYQQLGASGWIDIPSNLHNGAGSFSFADGHAEIHKWVGRLMSTLTYVPGGDVAEINYEGSSQPEVETQADLKDLNWVQARTSYPINPASAPDFP